MDMLFIFDVLIISSYVVFIAFISPFIIRFLKNRKGDWLLQSASILVILLISSFVITSIAYDSQDPSPFFQLTSIFSFSLLFLLLIIFIVKVFWKEHYEKGIAKLYAARNKIGQRFSHLMSRKRCPIRRRL